MTNRLEINWKLDGFVDEQRYYCSETPIDVSTLPTPKAVLAGDARIYIDADGVAGKKYYLRIGSMKNGVEKLSEEKTVIFGNVWNPDHASPAIYFDAGDLSSEKVSSWIDRKTGGSLTQANTSYQPTLSELNGQKAVLFNGINNSIESTTALLNSVMKNTNNASVFVVLEKLSNDTISTNRRIISFFIPTGGVRFSLASDDGTTNNQNRLVLGGRVLDADTFSSLASVKNISMKKIIAFSNINYADRKIMHFIDGSYDSEKTAFTSSLLPNTNTQKVCVGGENGLYPFHGKISAIVVFNTVVSDADRQKLEGWAAHKYGLTANLPVDHPYKTLVPVL